MLETWVSYNSLRIGSPVLLYMHFTWTIKKRVRHESKLLHSTEKNCYKIVDDNSYQSMINRWFNIDVTPHLGSYFLVILYRVQTTRVSHVMKNRISSRTCTSVWVTVRHLTGVLFYTSPIYSNTTSYGYK